MRTETLKYVVYPGVEPPREALYNLEQDPDEMRDLAADPAWLASLERLRGRYRAYLDRLGPPP